jgi:septal ring factor EnvC (AmiA/AmiB activator)
MTHNPMHIYENIHKELKNQDKNLDIQNKSIDKLNNNSKIIKDESKYQDKMLIDLENNIDKSGSKINNTNNLCLENIHYYFIYKKNKN